MRGHDPKYVSEHDRTDLDPRDQPGARGTRSRSASRWSRAGPSRARTDPSRAARPPGPGTSRTRSSAPPRTRSRSAPANARTPPATRPRPTAPGRTRADSGRPRREQEQAPSRPPPRRSDPSVCTTMCCVRLELAGAAASRPTTGRSRRRRLIRATNTAVRRSPAAAASWPVRPAGSAVPAGASAPRPNGLSRASTSAYTSKLSPIREPGRSINDACGNIHQRRSASRRSRRRAARSRPGTRARARGSRPARRPPASTRSPSGSVRYDVLRGEARDRAQRVGQPPDRAAEQGERDDADPDPHVQPGRRRVQRRRTAAEPRGAEQQRERRQPGELEQPPRRRLSTIRVRQSRAAYRR